jgi:hypothetical protein
MQHFTNIGKKTTSSKMNEENKARASVLEVNTRRIQLTSMHCEGMKETRIRATWVTTI